MSSSAPLQFRDFQRADLPTIAQAMGDARVTQFYGLETSQTAPTAIAKEQLDWFASLAAEGEGWWQAITRNGDVLGALGVYDLDDEGDSADLGFWLLPTCWGQGLMQQALRQWLPQAFARLGLHSVVAYVEPDNRASGKLLQAAGFQYEGLLRECTKRGARYVSLQRYSLLAHELKALKV